METVTFRDLIAEVATKSGVSKKIVSEILKTCNEVIVSHVSEGDQVRLHGLGSFIGVKKEARSARNPSTGEEVKTKAHTVPRFKVSKQFKLKVY